MLHPKSGQLLGDKGSIKSLTAWINRSIRYVRYSTVKPQDSCLACLRFYLHDVHLHSSPVEFVHSLESSWIKKTQREVFSLLFMYFCTYCDPCFPKCKPIFQHSVLYILNMFSRRTMQVRQSSKSISQFSSANLSPTSCRSWLFSCMPALVEKQQLSLKL